MQFQVSIAKTFSNDEITYLFTDGDAMRVQNAMAIPIADICHNNFGYSGQDRPKEWPPLSRGYAEEFHDGEQTPTLQLSGNLQGSISIDPSNGDYSRVYTDNEYAEEQQWGIPGRLHARPFFPLVGDANASELTPFAVSEATSAAVAEVERILSGK